MFCNKDKLLTWILKNLTTSVFGTENIQGGFFVLFCFFAEVLASSYYVFAVFDENVLVI